MKKALIALLAVVGLSLAGCCGVNIELPEICPSGSPCNSGCN